jgi:predicted SAM-dependent methyltransferase
MRRPEDVRRKLRAALSRVGLQPATDGDLTGVDVVRLAYNMILDREPDETGLATYTAAIAEGRLSPRGIAEELLASAEFEAAARYPARLLNFSLHWSRRDFVRSLPPARQILDLGGSWKWSAEGALLALGYPYSFESLTIVDLPSDDRHESYRSEHHGDVATASGLVRYDYRSMADLSPYPDASFDLVYSGQSIEHVTLDDGARVLSEAYRVLRPGGWLALDTPNAKVCRLIQAEFMDPDHKVEYTVAEIVALVERAGFRLDEVKGLNYVGEGCGGVGRFSAAEVAGNRGLFRSPDDCYLTALVARKPFDSSQ